MWMSGESESRQKLDIVAGFRGELRGSLLAVTLVTLVYRKTAPTLVYRIGQKNRFPFDGERKRIDIDHESREFGAVIERHIIWLPNFCKSEVLGLL